MKEILNVSQYGLHGNQLCLNVPTRNYSGKIPTCGCESETGLAKSSQVTTSEQGGVVKEPL